MSRPAVRNSAPIHITIVRALASAQKLTASIFSVVVAIATGGVVRSDRAAEQAGGPNEWAGIGEFFGILLLVLSIASVVLIAIPLVQLRAGHPGARIALIVGEAIAACPALTAYGYASA